VPHFELDNAVGGAVFKKLGHPQLAIEQLLELLRRSLAIPFWLASTACPSHFHMGCFDWITRLSESLQTLRCRHWGANPWRFRAAPIPSAHSIGTGYGC
jgi:hypothetical protein